MLSWPHFIHFCCSLAFSDKLTFCIDQGECNTLLVCSRALMKETIWIRFFFPKPLGCWALDYCLQCIQVISDRNAKYVFLSIRHISRRKKYLYYYFKAFSAFLRGFFFFSLHSDTFPQTELFHSSAAHFIDRLNLKLRLSFRLQMGKKIASQNNTTESSSLFL